MAAKILTPQVAATAKPSKQQNRVKHCLCGARVSTTLAQRTHDLPTLRVAWGSRHRLGRLSGLRRAKQSG
jgi:hypothetical protein